MRPHHLAAMLAATLVLSACGSSATSPEVPTATVAAVPSLAAPTETPTPSRTPAPTARSRPTLPPFSVLLRVASPDGFWVGASSVTMGPPYGSGDATFDRDWLLTLPKAGTYCVRVVPYSFDKQLDTVYGPGFTLSATGSLIADSDFDILSNPGCALTVTEQPQEIELTLPPLTLVSGVVRDQSGEPCGGAWVRASSGRLETNPTLVVGYNGSYEIFLTRATWTLGAQTTWRSEEWSPQRSLTVGAQEIQGFDLQCPD